MGIDIHNLNFLAHARDLGVTYERTLAIGRQALFVEDWALEAHRVARGLPPLDETPAPTRAEAAASIHRTPPRAEPAASMCATPPPAEPAASIPAAPPRAEPAASIPAAPPRAEPAASIGPPRYFEPLMTQWYGAQVADSVDASPYEQAPLIHDMNLPWPADGALGAARGAYDAVLDFGCLEHVFNFPVAWRNCVDLCRVGGHVLHALPANNLAGHGFYQFSPELFFNLYRPANGFELRGLYFALKADPRHWWRVADPLQVKRRVNLCNAHEVYMLVLARKLREPGVLPAPQQSDYAQDEWVHGPAAAAGAPAANGRRALVRTLARLGVADSLRAARERWRAARASGLDLPGPDYQRVDVARLVARAGR